MKANSGFTLLELILVMVIISILAGMVVFNVADRGKEARIVRTKADLSVYQKAIEAYALENNDKYPRSLEDLMTGKRQYVVKLENDPWGNPYIYVHPGKRNKYDLLSRGPDEKQDTDDDISFWEY